MNFRFFFLILSFLPFCSAYGYPPAPVYPVAPSGPEFEKEAEAFVVARAVHMSDSEIKERLRTDSRNWEPVLEKLIREPSVHGMTVSAFAFAYSAYRGTAGDPQIVAATGEFFDRHVQEALVRYQKYSQEGKPTHPSVAGTFSGVTYEILKIGSAAHLTRVLDYLNSPADEKIRLIDRNVPQEVAAALRSYGDGTHLEVAGKFAKRLREAGKSEIADDIDRSIERIRKAADKRQASSTDGTSGKSKDGPGTNDKSNANGKPRWPWLAAGVALITALVAYFRLKRAGT